jgi:hypothetical protein
MDGCRILTEYTQMEIIRNKWNLRILTISHNVAIGVAFAGL